MYIALLCAALLGQIDADPLAEHDLPIVPIADDAYTMWWMWPWQRIGARAQVQRFGDGETLDAQGPGVMYFMQYEGQRPFEVDGTKHERLELGSVPYPLALNTATPYSELRWTPISFTDRLRASGDIAGEAIFHRYSADIPLSRPIVSWKGVDPPDHESLEMIRQAGTRLFPYAEMESFTASWSDAIGGGGPYFGSLLYRVRPNTKGYAFERQHVDEPHLVRAIVFTIPKANLDTWERARLQIWWDGRDAPSVDAPLSLFFGAGTLYNPDDREYLVKGFPSWIRFDDTTVTLACYWPMPFFESARLSLYHPDPSAITAPATVRILYEPFEAPANHLGYFHGTFHAHEATTGDKLPVLNTRGAEGESEWSGSYVGMSWVYSGDAGSPHYSFDGGASMVGRTPRWGSTTITLPLAGRPVDAREGQDARARIHSAYRFHLADLMPFGREATISLESTNTNAHESVAYWYGIPAPSLIETDRVVMSDKTIPIKMIPDNHGLLLQGPEHAPRIAVHVSDAPNGEFALGARGDDAILIPRELTRGKDQIYMRIDPPPRSLDGVEYRVNCFVLPDFTAGVEGKQPTQSTYTNPRQPDLRTLVQ